MAAFLARDMSLHTRGAVLVVISIVFSGIAFALVLLRLGARLGSKRKLGMDDYAILLSLVRFADICVDCQELDGSLMVSRSSQLDSPPLIASVSVCARLELFLKLINALGVDHGYGRRWTTLTPNDMRIALEVQYPQTSVLRHHT